MKKLQSILLAFLCLFILFGATACTPEKSEFSVTYKVTGTAPSANLTIGNATGGTEQFSVAIPWERTFTASRGCSLYLSAQNSNSYGSVTSGIWVDGVKCRESTSEGASVIATSSALLDGAPRTK